MQKGVIRQKCQFSETEKKNTHEQKNTKMPFFRTNINLNHCATLLKLPEPIGARLDGDIIV